jgi:hypothetical protein
MYGPLPSGARYKGEIQLSYNASVVSIEYDPKASCPPPPECPQPP